MDATIRRRDMLAATGAIAAGGLWAGATGAASRPAGERPARGDDAFPISLNTSTLRGYKLPLAEVIDIAAETGYRGIEPWPDEIDRHLAAGGSLADLDRRIRDHGLKVTGAIAFFPWMVDDDAARAKAFDEAKRRLEQLAAIGGSHMAAPPAGDVERVSLLAAAERYRVLLDIAAEFGVTPAVEVWGFAKNVHRLGQAVLIAMEADHPRACVLPDVYHLYKGGSGLGGVASIRGTLLGGFHINDYPADPPRETIADKDRVYPGDGIAPLGKLFRDLRDIGYQGAVSVELFNETYWRQEPRVVAKTALEKTHAVMKSALSA